MAWMMEGVRWPFGYVDPPEYVVLASNGKQVRYEQPQLCRRVRDDVSGLDIPHNGWYVCSLCGEPLPIINRYCGGCGAKVMGE